MKFIDRNRGPIKWVLPSSHSDDTKWPKTLKFMKFGKKVAPFWSQMVSEKKGVYGRDLKLQLQTSENHRKSANSVFSVVSCSKPWAKH